MTDVQIANLIGVRFSGPSEVGEIFIVRRQHETSVNKWWAENEDADMGTGLWAYDASYILKHVVIVQSEVDERDHSAYVDIIYNEFEPSTYKGCRVRYQTTTLTIDSGNPVEDLNDVLASAKRRGATDFYYMSAVDHFVHDNSGYGFSDDGLLMHVDKDGNPAEAPEVDADNPRLKSIYAQVQTVHDENGYSGTRIQFRGRTWFWQTGDAGADFMKALEWANGLTGPDLIVTGTCYPWDTDILGGVNYFSESEGKFEK